MAAFPLNGLYALLTSHPAVSALSLAALASLSLAVVLSLHPRLPEMDLAQLLDSGPGKVTQRESTPSRPQVQITGVASSAFNTVIDFEVCLARPMEAEEIATVSSLGLRSGAGGELMAGEAVSQELMAGGAGFVTAEFPTPLMAEDFTLSVGELVIVPNGGDGLLAG